MIAIPSGFVSAHPSHPSQSGTGSQIVRIAAGSFHSLALKADGTVVAWGDNNRGQSTVPAGLTGVAAIEAGGNHSLALKADGTVVAWGSNGSGQSTVPTGLTGVVAVSGGGTHSLALKADGTVVAWGDNGFGQRNVPTGLTEPGTVVAIAAGGFHSLALRTDGTVVAWGDDTYDQSTVPTGLTGVIAIAAGAYHSLALKADGTVVAWGRNVEGQINVPAGLTGVVAIAAETFYSLALKADGTVVVWGDTNSGQLNVPSGLSGVTAIAAGGYHVLALKADGTVVAWGRNTEGQRNVPAGLDKPVKGIGIAAGGYHSLALKADGTIVAWGRNFSDETNVPSGLSGVTAIAAGENHSLALKTDGTVVAWGRNFSDETNVPSGLSGVVAIAAGGYHSLALKADGTVVAWGNNVRHQTDVPSGLSGVVAISAGVDHSLALKADGTVVAWGDNGFGQRNVPSGLSGVTAIAAGGYHSLALKADGTVVAWGDNNSGQLNVPSGLSGVVAIAAGMFYSLALKADGTVVAWGESVYGETAVPAELTEPGAVTAIAVKWFHSLALKADGTVVAWGRNDLGQSNVPGDGRLSGLTVQEGALNPVFDPSVAANYSMYVAASVSSVHITATLADANSAELYVDNKPQASGTAAAVNISGASTVIPIRVEPYLKPPQTYTITVLKDDEPPGVQFAPNGSALPAQTVESTVTVTDAESGVDTASLQYAWTQSTAVPADGWTSFASGAKLEKTSGDGSWYLHIRALDMVGNVTEAVSSAFVLDNTAPVIALNGSNPMHIPQGGTYTEPGATALDAIDGAIPESNIAISGAVDTAQLGHYPIQYSVTDRAGNTATVTRDVYVYDGDAPAIVLKGASPMTVEANSLFEDPGATAYDVQDGDISASIVVTGTVDTATLGTYTLFYNVSDSAGNAAPTVTRTVYVKDTQPPVLTLLGDPVMSVPYGAAFVDPGATATDAYYGDVSPLIVVTGTVDTSKPGKYTLRYNVTDPSGNAAAEVTRTVTVAAPEVPDGSDESEDTAGRPAANQYVRAKMNGVIKWVHVSYETSGGQRFTRISLTAEQLSEAFAAEPDGIRIELADIGDSVKMDLPAAPLLHALKLRPDVWLEWRVNGNALHIPLRTLQGVSEEETVTFTIAAADSSVIDAWNEWIARTDAEPLLLHPIVYSLQTSSGDWIDWALAYATLTVALPEPANAVQATAVRIDENGRIRFAPSVFSNDGSPLVTIRSPYAGVYSVIRSDHSFADVIGHWARKEIVLMANKLIVEGRTQDRFVPDDPISRAEFAALLVRALGLDDEPNGPTPFRDVAPGAWYAGAVRAAYQHRLINGFEDGTFRPADPITREQMAVMIDRAMAYAEYAPDANGAATGTFADEADIAPWADAAIDRLTRASIINGLTETQFGPREYATRAQSAVLLKRMLQTMQWINP
jgi:alpha-tubulin suppressor-like RCC1 family protein